MLFLQRAGKSLSRASAWTCGAAQPARHPDQAEQLPPCPVFSLVWVSPSRVSGHHWQRCSSQGLFKITWPRQRSSRIPQMTAELHFPAVLSSAAMLPVVVGCTTPRPATGPAAIQVLCLLKQSQYSSSPSLQDFLDQNTKVLNVDLSCGSPWMNRYLERTPVSHCC